MCRPLPPGVDPPKPREEVARRGAGERVEGGESLGCASHATVAAAVITIIPVNTTLCCTFRPMNTHPLNLLRRPQRILHCITDLSPDGAQRTLLRLAQQLEGRGFKNRIIALKGGGELAPKVSLSGLRVDELSFAPGAGSVVGLWKLQRIIREWQPDTIQGWMYHGNVAALVATRLARWRAPVLWNVRRSLYEESTDKAATAMLIRIGARMSRGASGIVYCAELAADQHEGIGFDPRKRIVVPNGFDVQRFRPTDEYRARLRAELGLPTSTVLVGAAGRYHVQKDWPNFFRAAARVRRELPEVHFVGIGRGVTHANEEIVRALYGLGLRARFHLLGERHDMPQLLSALDLFVSSSLNEGFSNVLGEALACGLPCVSTDAGGARELLSQLGEDGHGLVVPRMDSVALGRAIVRVLSLPESAQTRLSQRGRALIVEGYSLEAMVSRYAQVYGGGVPANVRPRVAPGPQAVGVGAVAA